MVKTASTKAMASVVGRNLLEMRAKRGLSQDRLADALQATGLLNWTQTTVRDVELGNRHVRLEEALALCAFFCVPLERLLVGGFSEVPLGENRWATKIEVLTLLGRFGDPEEVLPSEETVNAFSGRLPHAPMTPKLRKELEAFKKQGGDVRELRHLRDMLARGQLHEKEYAGMKLGLLRKMARETEACR